MPTQPPDTAEVVFDMAALWSAAQYALSVTTDPQTDEQRKARQVATHAIERLEQIASQHANGDVPGPQGEGAPSRRATSPAITTHAEAPARAGQLKRTERR